MMDHFVRRTEGAACDLVVYEVEMLGERLILIIQVPEDKSILSLAASLCYPNTIF